MVKEKESNHRVLKYRYHIQLKKLSFNLQVWEQKMISKKILNFVKRKKNGFKDDFTLLRLERMKM